MKTYNIQYMTPEGDDGFCKVKAKDENEAIAKFQTDHLLWIVVDAYRL